MMCLNFPQPVPEPVAENGTGSGNSSQVYFSKNLLNLRLYVPRYR
jgi:hypothetical protein